MSTETNIGTIQGVKINASTPAGAAYVKKVTHPPSNMSSDYLGRPDCSSPNVVLIELKSEQNVAPILVVPTSATANKTVNPSSMLFLQSSGAVVSNYVFLYLSDASISTKGWVQPQGQLAITTGPELQPTVTQTTTQSTNMAGYSFSNWQSDVASHRKTYKSSTYYLNATNFNNQGVVTTAKFKPDIVQGLSLLSLYDSHRGDNKSTTSLLNATRASLNMKGYTMKHNQKPQETYNKNQQDDEFIVLDNNGYKLPGEQMSYQILDFGTFTTQQGADLPFSNQIFYNTLLPETSSQVLMSSPKSSTRPAKDVAFVVLQQEDEIIPWVANNANNVLSVPAGLTLSFMRYSVSGVATYIPLYSSALTGNTYSPSTAEVQWSSLDWSMTLFEGLTVPTTVGTTLTSVPYVTVKSFVGLEIQPRSTSSITSFQRTLPLPDDDAIRMVIGIMHARPDSLPASANDLASIATTAIKFIPTAVEWLKNIFGSKTEEKKVVDKEINKKMKNNNQIKPKKMQKRGNENTRMLEQKINSLTNSINRMKLLTNKSVEPATRLPSYGNQMNKQKPRNNKMIKTQVYESRRQKQ